MGSGKLKQVDLNIIADLLPKHGDLAEVGVLHGHLFNRLVALAKERQCKAHAFDSFEGMDVPTEADGGKYGKGSLNVGGLDNFKKIMADRYNIFASEYVTHEGFIPHCFDTDQKFAFIYIDVDHAVPTQLAIQWALAHLLPEGVIGFDDYFPDRKILASPAIDEFLEAVDHNVVHENKNRQIFVTLEG